MDGDWMVEECCDGRMEKEEEGVDWMEEECDGGKMEEEEQGSDYKEEEECCNWRVEEEKKADDYREECGSWRMEEEEQSEALGRGRWRCSRCGWGSRSTAPAGWNWECCGDEEVEQQVWELRRR